MFSQPVLLALVAAGRSRDDAYRIVQTRRPAVVGRTARTSVACSRTTPTCPSMPLPSTRAFDLERALGNVDVVFDALDAIR